ncbi:MAG: phosphotransferase [Pseudonocardiaceae bacterium]
MASTTALPWPNALPSYVLGAVLACWQQSDAEEEVSVARWLAKIEFPAVHVYDVAQPISVRGCPVTFWFFVGGRPGDQRDIAALGSVLRCLHATPPPSTFLLPREDILGRVRRRIEVAVVPPRDKSFLLRRLSELQAELPGLRYPLRPAPTHGDAHTENLIICDDRPVLIDFEVCHEHAGRFGCRGLRLRVWCCAGDGGGPSGTALQGEVSNHRMLLRSETGWW